jgi:hypothetical protein
MRPDRPTLVHRAAEQLMADYSTHVATGPWERETPDDADAASIETVDDETAEGSERRRLHAWLKERQPPPVLRSGPLRTLKRWGE